VFCETRPLAQEWTYRWLGACLSELTAADDRRDLDLTFAAGAPVVLKPVPAPRDRVLNREVAVDSAAVRVWARAQGIAVNDRGRLPKSLVDAFRRGQVQQ
jgi:hypothetical protein